jgi:hypothetical protein
MVEIHLPNIIPTMLKRKQIAAISKLESHFILTFRTPYDIPTPKLSILDDSAKPNMNNHSILYSPFIDNVEEICFLVAYIVDKPSIK